MQIASFNAKTPPSAPANWDEVKGRTITFLRAGEIIMIALEMGEDECDPTVGCVVPVGFRTDGSWIWSMELEYYADKYSMPIDQDLLCHVLSLDFTMPVVSPESANTALEELMKAAAEYAPEGLGGA